MKWSSIWFSINYSTMQWTMFCSMVNTVPVTVAERSKAWMSSLARTPGPWVRMDVWCLWYVCVFLCLCTGRGLATSWSPVQGVLPTVLDLVTEVKRKVSWRRPRTELGCRARGKKKSRPWWLVRTLPERASVALFLLMRQFTQDDWQRETLQNNAYKQCCS
jgi:hypothetical protein